MRSNEGKTINILSLVLIMMYCSLGTITYGEGQIGVMVFNFKVSLLVTRS